jgi:RNA polymerase sigma-70 factor (ECF subfamily)
MGTKYEGVFEGWEIGVAKEMVGKTQAKRPCLQRDDFEDLLCECLEHWLSVRDRYKTDRKASRRTFMARVVRNKLSDLVRQREADIRKAIYVAESLDEPLKDAKDGSGDETTLLDRIDPGTIPTIPREPLSRVPLQIDLSKTLGCLTGRQRKICDLLAEPDATVAEVSRCLKTPRTTLKDEIKRIRAIFEKAGLGDYLRRRPDTSRK